MPSYASLQRRKHAAKNWCLYSFLITDRGASGAYVCFFIIIVVLCGDKTAALEKVTPSVVVAKV